MGCLMTKGTNIDDTMEDNYTSLEQVKKLLNAGIDIFTSDTMLKRNMITRDWVVETNFNHGGNVTKITKDGRACYVTIANLPDNSVEREAFIESNGIAPCWSLNALVNTVPTERVTVKLIKNSNKADNDKKACLAKVEFDNPGNEQIRQKKFYGENLVEAGCQMVLFYLENKQYFTQK